ncbi:MAG: DUF5615 family PIN-like protein [Caldilineales bacterium]|nr:DUF5615 family PIN-like protein [Caldilineales bacterium]
MSWRIARALREYGYDVVNSYKLRMNTEEDDIQFSFAIAHQRAVLTNNIRDFVNLHK